MQTLTCNLACFSSVEVVRILFDLAQHVAHFAPRLRHFGARADRRLRQHSDVTNITVASETSWEGGTGAGQVPVSSLVRSIMLAAFHKFHLQPEAILVE